MMHWLVLLALLTMVNMPMVKAQSWTITRECIADETDTPSDFTFEGALFSIDRDDGFKAYRENPSTFYYIAFAGSNFVHAGALSPDGVYYAVPYGTIQIPLADDVRYRVQEIRVFSTDRVPQIVRFIGWSATFQVGGFGDIPSMRWLDNETLLFAQGSVVDDDLSYVTVRPFDEDVSTTDTALRLDAELSPDLSRSVVLQQGKPVLLDNESSQIITQLSDNINTLIWSPDSQQFVISITDGTQNTLQLFDRDGALIDTLWTGNAERVVRNLRWSPDADRIAFSLFDPQSVENVLYIADLSAQSLRDTCLLLDTLYLGGRDGGGVVWSPDGTQLAILSASADYGFTQIVNLTENTRYGMTGYNGGLVDWE